MLNINLANETLEHPSNNAVESAKVINCWVETSALHCIAHSNEKMPLKNKTRHYLPSSFVLFLKKYSLFKAANENGRGTVRWLADDLPWVQVEIKSAWVNEACRPFLSWGGRVFLFCSVFRFNCKHERMCKGLRDLECCTCRRLCHRGSAFIPVKWGERSLFTSLARCGLCLLTCRLRNMILTSWTKHDFKNDILLVCP